MKEKPTPKEEALLQHPKKVSTVWAKIKFAIGLLFGGWKGN